MRWLAIALVAVGCGDFRVVPNDAVPPSNLEDVRVPLPAPDPSYVDIVTPDGIVQPGEGKMFCYYFTSPAGDIAIDDMVGLESVGAHHIAVMTTTTPKPAGTFEDCTSAEANANLRWFMLPTAGLTVFPAGTAMSVPANKLLLVQFHIINATDSTLLVRDIVRLHKVDPATVTTWAATMAAGDVNVTLPPGPSELSWDCALTDSRELVAVFGHMHDIGSKFALDVGPTSDQLTRLYTVDAWQPNYRDLPPIQTFYDQPVSLPAGSILRTTCDWMNATDAIVAFPYEMCITFAYLTGSPTPAQCNPIATRASWSSRSFIAAHREREPRGAGALA